MIHRKKSEFKPVIFIPEEGNDSLSEVFLEEHLNFDIYWFHWPHDGFTPEEDYEPVAIIYKTRGLCCVITRRGWCYKTYMLEDGFQIPLEILFDTSFHHPYVKVQENSELFALIREGLISTEYEPKNIQPNRIPIKFRNGMGHFTNFKNLWIGKVEDPAAYTKKIYNRYFR